MEELTVRADREADLQALAVIHRATLGYQPDAVTMETFLPVEPGSA